MTHGKDKANTQPMSMSNQDVLTNILRQGTQKMPAEAIENEVVEYLDRHACVWDDQGHRLAVRNGYVSHKFFRARRMPVGALGMSGLAIVCFFHLQLADWSRLGNSIGISFLVSCRGYQWCRLPWPDGFRFCGRVHSKQIRLEQPVLFLRDNSPYCWLLVVKWNWFSQACKQKGEGS